MIKCLAIDDEPLALQQLASYMQKVPFFELVASCNSAAKAKSILDKELIDAIFIDINMPDLNGLDFVRTLEAPPLVVFTTAYSEYAVEGYKVNAIDYLLKPFGMNDMMRAALKVKHHIELSQVNKTTESGDDTIFFRTDHKVVRIRPNEIMCVEGMGEYLRIHLTGKEKPLIVLLSMKKIEDRLCPLGFMRIHRSYIINLRCIAEVSKNRVILDNGASVPIGDNFRESLNTFISDNYLGK